MAFYSPFALDMVTAQLGSVTLKALLVDGTFTQGAEETLDDLNALGVEVVDAGYTAGGVAATSVAITFDGGSNSVVVTCDPIVFGPFSGNVDVGAVVLYIDTGVASTSTLIAADTDESGTALASSTLTYLTPDGLLQFPL